MLSTKESHILDKGDTFSVYLAGEFTVCICLNTFPSVSISGLLTFSFTSKENSQENLEKLLACFQPCPTPRLS